MTHEIDISGEFLICRHLNGFKLVSPEAMVSQQQLCLQPITTVAGVLRSPFSVYFTSKMIVYECNDACLLSINRSRSKIIKKDYSRFVSDPRQAQVIVANDKWIVKNECQKIFHEFAELINSNSLQVVSFKAPWYDNASRVIGIFGCSVLVNSTDFMQTIDHIITLSNLFLLSNQSVRGALLGYEIQGNHFTRREVDVIQQVVQGKTLRESAENLGLSTRTVEYYFDHVKSKAGVSTKSQLIQLIKGIAAKL